jgi:glucan phosphorylase
MRQAIRTSAAYFNSDRMVVEYYNRLYKPIAHAGLGAGIDDADEDEVASETPDAEAWTYSNIK